MTRKQLEKSKNQVLDSFWWRPALTLSEIAGVSGIGIDQVLKPVGVLLIEGAIEVSSGKPLRYRRV